MKVLYDHQMFCLQRYGGISRYFAELIAHVTADEGFECELALRVSDNVYVEKLAAARHLRLPRNWRLRGRSVLLKRLNEGCSRRALQRGDFDVFHPTYFEPYFLEHIGSRPFVLTIYDMIHELVLHEERTCQWKKQLAARAARVITISESTRRDIVKVLGIDAQKIDVIHLGNSLRVPAAPGAAGVARPDRYVLFVGERGGYKNFAAFAAAVAPLLREDRGLCVLCAGGGTFKAGEQKQLQDLGIAPQVVQRDVGEGELACLYRDALCFVFPSRYEGFGIPILEAFACGAPVAASDATSLPEVAGDAAVYFDPADKDSMLNAIRGVVQNRDLGDDLKRRGHIREQLFSWGQTARQTAAVYARVAQRTA